MTFASRCTHLVTAVAAFAVVATATIPAAQAADSLVDPLGIQGLIAKSPTRPLYGYRHHHRYIRESLDKRKARYALGRACKSSFVSADVCKFTASLIAMSK